MEQHIPVFYNEAIKNLEIKPQGVYVDVTLGAGGHAGAILERLQGGTLVAFDVEELAISGFITKQDLKKVTETEYRDVRGNNVILVNQNFRSLNEVMQAHNLLADGILADLGWSSEQLDRIPGLSYSRDDSLDMRLDKNLGVTARDLLHTLSSNEMKILFEQNADIYGRELHQLIDAILKARQVQQINSTQDLRNIVMALPATATRTQHQLLSRVFQALRIAVNSELSTLQSFLHNAFNSLNVQGRLLVISFHSGEAKIIEIDFKERTAAGNAVPMFAQMPLRPTVAELRQNMRAHSAALWGIIKLK